MNITTVAIGKQDDFKDAMQGLLELENNTKSLYELAIDKITNEEYKNKLSEFKEEHVYHIQKLHEFLNNKEQISIMVGIIKPLMNTIKLEFANLIGDKAKLASVLDNEMETHKVYERLNARHDKWLDTKEFLKQALKDEKKHRSWLEETIKSID